MNALKKGMADTGAEITKLSDEIKQLNKKASSQNRALKRIVLGVFNISVSLNVFIFNSYTISRVVHVLIGPI